MSPDEFAPDKAYWPPRWTAYGLGPSNVVAPIDLIIPLPVRVMLSDDPANRRGRYYITGGRRFDETRTPWHHVPERLASFLESIQSNDLADVRMALLHAQRLYEDKT